MAYSARMLNSENDIKHVSQQGENNVSKLIENTLSMESMMRRINDRVRQTEREYGVHSK